MTKLNFKDTYSSLTSSEIVAKEQSNMDDARFQHCVRVSETARKLAELNNYDPDKAALAGFVHDYAKQVPVEEYIKVIKTKNFDQDLLNWSRAIWHGIVGTYFIQHDLRIDDPEIIQAVNRHTTADVEMTTLDKIVYMADYIEPGRDFPGVEEHTLEYLIEHRSKIYPRTLEAYNVWSVK